MKAPADIPDATQNRPGSNLLKSVLIWSDVAVFIGIVVAVMFLGPLTWLWFAGLAIAGASFVLWMVARRQLGKSFMAGAAARQLVSTGFYRRLKHPIYYFGTLAHLGAFVALQNWWILAVWLVYTAAVQWTRMKREDRVLEEAFGEDFKDLRRGTWF